MHIQVYRRRGTPDWMFEAFWAHPERVFDPAARAATSSFARMDPRIVDRVLRELRRGLDIGTWDARHWDCERSIATTQDSASSSTRDAESSMHPPMTDETLAFTDIRHPRRSPTPEEDSR